MVRVFNTLRTLCAAILAATIFMAGCGSNSSSQAAAGETS